MKYRAVVMVPQFIEFENPGSFQHVTNQAAAMLDSFQSIKVGDTVYEPKLMGCYPAKKFGDQPLVFDPPPQAA